MESEAPVANGWLVPRLTVVVLLWPVSLFGHSDLDRDFWNNNDSSNVQQRWSSYPPKEFLLNMSPYAPYGDPRLTPKWVSFMAGKGPLYLGRAVMNRGLNTPWKTSLKLYDWLKWKDKDFSAVLACKTSRIVFRVIVRVKPFHAKTESLSDVAWHT